MSLYYIDQSAGGGINNNYGILVGDVNGVNKIFTVSQSLYVAGSLFVARNGQILGQGSLAQYTETSPATGVFELAEAPLTGDTLMVYYKKEDTTTETPRKKFPEQFTTKTTPTNNDYFLISDSGDTDNLKRTTFLNIKNATDLNFNQINTDIEIVKPDRGLISTATAQNTHYEVFRWETTTSKANMKIVFDILLSIGKLTAIASNTFYRFDLERSISPFTGSSTGSNLDLVGTPNLSFCLSFDSSLSNRATFTANEADLIRPFSVKFIDPDTGTAGTKYYRLLCNMGGGQITSFRIEPRRSHCLMYKYKS